MAHGGPQRLKELHRDIYYLVFQIFSEVEKLPFPTYGAMTDAIVALETREESKIKILMLSIILGMFYGVFLYFIPFISGGKAVPIPLPWIDLNYYLQFVLPGASLGFATSLTIFAFSFIIPFNVLLWMFIGAFAVHVIGNTVLVSMGIWKTWAPNTDVFFAYRESITHFWMSPILGISIIAAVLPLIRHPQIISRSIRAMAAAATQEKTGKGFMQPSWLLIMYLIGSIINLIVIWYLIPGAPLFYLAVVLIGFIFIWNVISANAVAVTGSPILMPQLYQIILMGGGIRDVPSWFMPMYATTAPYGATWCGYMKFADLCGVRIREFVKAWIIIVVIGTVMCFFYTQALWSMAEMPSYVYPWLQKTWPVEATIWLWWIDVGTGGHQLLNTQLIVGAAGVVSVIYLLSEFLRLPFSLIGLLIGMNTYIPIVTTQMLGGIMGRFVLPRILGKEFWNKNKSLIAAGLVIGEGVIATISAAIALISKALWVLPY